MKLAEDPFSLERENGEYIPSVPTLNVVPSIEHGMFLTFLSKRARVGRLALSAGITESDMRSDINEDELIAKCFRLVAPGQWMAVAAAQIVDLHSQYRLAIGDNIFYETAPYPTRLSS